MNSKDHFRAIFDPHAGLLFGFLYILNENLHRLSNLIRLISPGDQIITLKSTA